ncbi:Fic family protein [Schaedlerella arabinosiphila]
MTKLVTQKKKQLQMTQPDKPNSRNQKYKSTVK